MHIAGRGDEALRRYRVSIPGVSYFLTLCLRDRTLGLTSPKVASAIRSEIEAVEAAGHWVLRAAVIMPDHLHLFVRLTGERALGRCVARLKSKTNLALRPHGLAWQGNFYEHRMRSDDPVEEVIRYIFLNPYRGKLVERNETYPWFWLGSQEEEWFVPTLNDEQPFPEWLQ